MAVPFLFINDDHISPTQRAKEVSSLIRGHARRYRTRRPSRRELSPLSRRPKELKTILPKIVDFTSPAHEEETEEDGFFADLHGIIDILSDQTLHYRMLQLEPETRRLIQFYLLWNDPQVQSSLAVSWPKWIVLTALKSELNLLVLPCYIASMASYLGQTASGIEERSHEAPPRASQQIYRFAGFESDSDWDSSRSSQSPVSSVQSLFPQAAEASTFDGSKRPTSPRSHVYLTPPNGNTPEIAHPLGPAALLSCSSSLLDDTHLPNASNLPHLTHFALEALQSRLSTKHKPSISTSCSSDLLFPVWCLFRAAIFQGDKFAAVSHERFLKHLVYRPDGSKSTSSRLVNVIVEVDLKLGQTRQRSGTYDKSSELLIKSEIWERMAVGP
jgi:hypothetical protein